MIRVFVLCVVLNWMKTCYEKWGMHIMEIPSEKKSILMTSFLELFDLTQDIALIISRDKKASTLTKKVLSMDPP